MELIGMLDSPYVRRVAVSLQLQGLPFTHRSVSVFRGFDQFRQINPVVKAPTLICDDGGLLMDSSLILEYAEGLAAKRRSLVPAEPAARLRCLRLTGLALAAIEKSAQIVYEHGVRPPEKLHRPWLERVTGQLRTALAELEAQLAAQPLPAEAAQLDQAGVTGAVAWQFISRLQPAEADAARFPRLAAFSAAAEQLAEFRAAPHGEGVYPVKA
ncbi:MAG: glutathione S-transferase [Burkholderiaceae bacterium]